MATLRQVLIKAAKVLAKKKIGPIRLAQTIHLPLGPINLITVGNLKRGLMPSTKDLMTVTKEVKRQERRLNGKPKSWSLESFWPPTIEVKELFLPKGTFYVVFVGNLEKCIMPTIKDLEEVRDRFHPIFRHLGVKKPVAMFFPPILEIKPTRYPGFDCVLGSKAFNILPSAKDIKTCRELVYEATKDLGVKFKNVKVESVTHKNFED